MEVSRRLLKYESFSKTNALNSLHSRETIEYVSINVTFSDSPVEVEAQLMTSLASIYLMTRLIQYRSGKQPKIAFLISLSEKRQDYQYPLSLYHPNYFLLNFPFSEFNLCFPLVLLPSFGYTLEETKTIISQTHKFPFFSCRKLNFERKENNKKSLRLRT